MGVGMSDMLQPPTRTEPTDDERALTSRERREEEELFESSADEGLEWERYHGSSQLQSPVALNSRQLRTAIVPAVSTHGSARALAAFYAALALPGRLFPPPVLRQIAQPLSHGSMHGSAACWGVGVQLGSVVDSAGCEHVVIGHIGLGGNLGLCVPECGVSLALTVSQLSTRCATSHRMVELLLLECGLKLKPGFLPPL